MSEEFKADTQIGGWTSYKFTMGVSPAPFYAGPPRFPLPDIRPPRWLAFLLGLALGLIIWWILSPVACFGTQMQPDAKRVKQIQTALVDHEYPAGKTWKDTQEILRGIARDHHWQTHRAPDARVLILLGLGNTYSNPAVALEGHAHLDGGPDGE